MVRISHKKEKQKEKSLHLRHNVGWNWRNMGGDLAKLWVVTARGERERGEWVKKGREGKRRKRSSEKETCHLRQTNEREREQGGCETRGPSLQYARCLHFLANPCLRYQDSKAFSPFFFFFPFFFLASAGIYMSNGAFHSLWQASKQASKEESKRNFFLHH